MSIFDKLFRKNPRRNEDEKGKKDHETDIALARAALHGQTDLVQALLKTGAHIDAQTIIAGWTPLMAAASEGKTEIVRILLDNAANINAADPGGSTALIIAARNGHADTLQLLLERGADVNNKSADGVSALSAAAAFGQILSVRLLLKVGAKDHDSALKAAAQVGHKEIVDLLRDHSEPLEI